MRHGPSPFCLDKAFKSFCEGVCPYGPFFDHVLEYWKESLKSSAKILFLKYEEMKRNPNEEVEKIASFLGRPFANDEDWKNIITSEMSKQLEEVTRSKLER
ncbi:hypothetical protein GIB67_005069 [Kingdonia uniflora]|uniref:Sulfotransferase n=1 Tax=Kingdonia uniflora TaxID=39325 RepID=A0A7J7P7Q4_9MAGN|nr:hypothetical protein GIB67_005069 [Kingdonia uniflora]